MRTALDVAAGLWLPVIGLAAFAAALSWWQRHRHGTDRIDALLDATREHPGPGKPQPPRAGAPSPARHPAPGHHTGGLAYTISTWRCGCVLMWDERGVITGTHPCPPVTDWDEALRRLAP